MDEIIDILKQKIGLNPNSIGESSIKRAVLHCMLLRNITTFEFFSKLIQTNTIELERLIEEIVVAETWFFRNSYQFKTLESYVVRTLLPKCNVENPIRILSVPCSTGEEPYSIAITLREAGVPAEWYEISAIDISQRSLNSALDACYSNHSFRDVEPNIVSNYFIKRNDTYHLVGLIKNRVDFSIGNVLYDTLRADYYDVIFCRNLLIYFDRDNQHQVLNKLYHALKDGGVLFVGHAEASQVSTAHFEQLHDHHSFAFKKKLIDSNEINTGISLQNTPGQWSKVFKDIAAIKQQRESLTPAKVQIVSAKERALYRTLIPAEKLAYEAKYNEAAGLCYEFLQHTPDSAQANYLLGLINNFQGEEKLAEKFLKKAIYLDPNHEAALSLSLEIAEKRGDPEAIKAFGRRVDRVRNRKLVQQ